LRVAFRKSAVSREKNTGVISAWLRQGEIEAVKIRCGQFDRQKFQRNIGEISKLTLQSPEVFVPKLESLCAEAGVAIVFIHALPRLGVYGATRWMGNKPVMQLSLYLKTNDHFWFTFFHESCHILKHGREGVFIEGHGIENEYENEADAFARDSLIPSAKLRHFLAQYPHPELYRIKRFAESISIAPGIVVGRLQHDKVLPVTIGNKLRAYPGIRPGCTGIRFRQTIPAQANSARP
jgi:hypothetical protein